MRHKLDIIASGVVRIGTTDFRVPLPYADVWVYERDTTTEADVYPSAIAGSPLSQPLKADWLGRPSGYVDLQPLTILAIGRDGQRDERPYSPVEAADLGGRQLGYAAITGPLSSTSIYPTRTDMAGLSLTYTVEDSTRPLIVVLYSPRLFQSSANAAIASIMDGSTELQFARNDGTNASPCTARATILNPSLGAHTFKIALSIFTGGAATLSAGTSSPASIELLGG